MPLYNRESLKLIGLEIAKFHKWGDEKLTDQTLIELGQQFWNIVEDSESITISEAAATDIDNTRPKPTEQLLATVRETELLVAQGVVERTIPNIEERAWSGLPVEDEAPQEIKELLANQQQASHIDEKTCMELKQAFNADLRPAYEILREFSGILISDAGAKDTIRQIFAKFYLYDNEEIKKCISQLKRSDSTLERDPAIRAVLQPEIVANRARIMARVFVAQEGNSNCVQEIESFVSLSIELERREKSELSTEDLTPSLPGNVEKVEKNYGRLKHWFYAREMGQGITDEKEISNLEKNKENLNQVMNSIFHTTSLKFIKDCHRTKAQWVFFVENNITKAYLANLPINRGEAKNWFQEKAKNKCNISVSFRTIPGSQNGNSYMVIDDFAQVQNLFAPTHATAPSFSRR